MKHTIILALLGTAAAFAQTEAKTVFFSQAGGVAMAGGATVQGAPYTATITNESVQTLADGNRIVQNSSGTMARDSMGRTRQDAPLPSIGNMAPANMPHLVFIRDPVAQTSYTLNLTDKTAMKGPSMMLPSLALADSGPGVGGAIGGRTGVIAARAIAGGGMVTNGQWQTVTLSKTAIEGSAKPQTEDLGSQTIEGVLANGTRTTFTIPAGEIGNDKPISIVTEVWTSPDLKTIVLSKRNDPRMGDQTFKLTNIVRAEPDPTLFTVPADFKINDEPQPIYYKATGAPAQ